jgi:hypothetical protein
VYCSTSGRGAGAPAVPADWGPEWPPGLAPPLLLSAAPPTAPENEPCEGDGCIWADGVAALEPALEPRALPLRFRSASPPADPPVAEELVLLLLPEGPEDSPQGTCRAKDDKSHE